MALARTQIQLRCVLAVFCLQRLALVVEMSPEEGAADCVASSVHVCVLTVAQGPEGLTREEDYTVSCTLHSSFQL